MTSCSLLSSLLLDRITELETNPQVNPGAPIPGPPFTAFPRSLLSVNSQKVFVSNLRQAIDEVDQEDPNIDPVVLSRHIGPDARKRQEEQRKQQEEEEAREARRQARRPRATQKGKEMSMPVQQYVPPQQPGQEIAADVGAHNAQDRSCDPSHGLPTRHDSSRDQADDETENDYSNDVEDHDVSPVDSDDGPGA